MAPPYIKRVLVLLITLLGTAHAPAPGGSNACAADGSSVVARQLCVEVELELSTVYGDFRLRAACRNH